MGKHHYKCLVCGRQERQTSSVRFFSVPKNSETRAKWFNCIKKPHLLGKQISKDYRVCEMHFSTNMYSKSMFRLKFSATPNLNISQNETSITEGGNEDNKYQNTSQVIPQEAANFISVPVNVDTQMKEGFDAAVKEAGRRSTEHQSMQTFFKETEQPITSTMLDISKCKAESVYEEWILPNQRSNIQTEVSIIKLEEEPMIEVFKSEPAELIDIVNNKCKDTEDLMDVKKECVTPEDFVSVRNEPENNYIFQDYLLMKSNQDALQYLKPLRAFLLTQKNSHALELLTHMELILGQESMSQREPESVSGMQLTEGEEILPKQSSNNPEKSKEEVSIIELKKERLEEPLLEVFKTEPYELIEIANSDCRDSGNFMDVQNECVTPEDFVSLRNERETNGIIFQDDPPIRSNQDALQQLKPIRTFLLSLGNSRALEFLTQMELLLVKPEIT